MLASCSKHNDNPNNPNNSVGSLMAFNLAPDQAGIFITLSGNSITQTPLGYTNYTGQYLNIYSGDRTAQSYSAGTGTSSLLASTAYNYLANNYYSLFVMGDSSHYRNVVANDNLDSLGAVSGGGYIRYVNAITDTVNQSTVTIAGGGSNVINENASFATVSPFKPVTAGNVSVEVKYGTTIDSTRTIVVEQNKVYTVLLTGIPGTTDNLKKVQIKYIVNGVISGAWAEMSTTCSCYAILWRRGHF